MNVKLVSYTKDGERAIAIASTLIIANRYDLSFIFFF